MPIVDGHTKYLTLLQEPSAPRTADLVRRLPAGRVIKLALWGTTSSTGIEITTHNSRLIRGYGAQNMFNHVTDSLL